MECISKSTTTNTIGQLEKLAIIAKLVCKYIQVDNIFSVIDLACSLIETMDELKFFNVSIDDLYHEYMSEHLEKRALFFNIVAQHWPKILEELDLDDCQNTYVLNKIEGTNDEDVCAQMPIIFSVDNIFEEVKCVFDIAKENIQKRIYIIADDKNFAIMLAEKFKNEGVEYGSYLESDKIDLDEITETFGCQNINQAKRIAQTINTYQNCVEQGNRILITNNRSLNTMIDESGNFLFSKETEGQAAECNTKPLIIASCMTGRQYGSHVISSYWLQDQVRTKLGLPTLKQHKKNIENNFYKLTNCAEVFATFSQKLDGTVTSMHSILRKLSSTQQENEAKLNEKKPQNTNAKQTDSSDSFQSTTEQRHANIEDLNATGQNANYEKDKAKIKGIPKELSLYEADLLLNDLYSFYIVDSLRIRPETYSIKDKKNETLRKLFAKLIKEILQNNSENMESILQDIASYDFYKYQQCRNIIKCLLSNVNKNNIWSKALVDIRGEAYWPVFLEELGDARILLKGRADVISNNSIIVLRMFEKKISATNIIDGTYSPPLMLCLLAKLGAFDYVNNGQKIDISEIQIWDMDGLWPNPIKISSIQISPETIDHFENKLRKKLLDYVVNQLTLGENNGKFRHYKRAVLPPASSGNG